jgi:hypothetical protein
MVYIEGLNKKEWLLSAYSVYIIFTSERVNVPSRFFSAGSRTFGFACPKEKAPKRKGQTKKCCLTHMPGRARFLVRPPRV